MAFERCYGKQRWRMEAQRVTGSASIEDCLKLSWVTARFFVTRVTLTTGGVDEGERRELTGRSCGK